MGSAQWVIAGPVSRATEQITQRGMATGPTTTPLGLQRPPQVMTIRLVPLSTNLGKDEDLSVAGPQACRREGWKEGCRDRAEEERATNMS
jgi:hypothetical protein